jgi:hypothetical protein
VTRPPLRAQSQQAWEGGMAWRPCPDSWPDAVGTSQRTIQGGQPPDRSVRSPLSRAGQALQAARAACRRASAVCDMRPGRELFPGRGHDDHTNDRLVCRAACVSWAEASPAKREEASLIHVADPRRLTVPEMGRRGTVRWWACT